MLCSISTGKSNSKWLDRLRSSKGFPSGNDLDLDQFLTLQNPNSSNSSHTTNIDPQSHTNSPQVEVTEILDRKQAAEIPKENGEKEWLGIMSNVLAELFYMGDSKDFPRIGKKSSRKQANPKICVVSKSPNGDGVRAGETALTVRSSDGSSRVEIKEKIERKNLTERESVSLAPVDCEEEEKCRVDLSGFSRTEVTVIDTSCSSWKFEKMLYRRKNVWKVRDKKCKVMNIGRKKRKLRPLDENVGEEKKLKVSIGKCSSSKEANGEEGKMILSEGHDQCDKMEEACKDTHQKRFPRKLKKGGSSVILIKNIPTSKKKAASIPKSCVK